LIDNTSTKEKGKKKGVKKKRVLPRSKVFIVSFCPQR
jgi:hypothetical protein